MDHQGVDQLHRLGTGLVAVIDEVDLLGLDKVVDGVAHHLGEVALLQSGVVAVQVADLAISSWRSSRLEVFSR